MIKRYLLAVSIFVSLVVSAQQDVQYTMYRFNNLIFNPAAAGSRDALSVVGIYRWQWLNVPGAPRTGSFSVHSPLRNNNLALGLTFTNDRIGVTHTNKLEGNFAYRIPLGKAKKVKLSLGVSAGVTNYRSKLTEVNTNGGAGTDPNFADNASLWLPNVGFGIYAYSQKFFVGVSVPNLLANSIQTKNQVFQTGVNDAHQYYHLFVTGGYVFDLGEKVKFAPSVMMKYVPKYAPIDFDFNANFIFIDRIWLGASYRLSDSYGFMAAFNITPQLRVGYAYDLTVSPISKFTTGSHEVMLGYDFDFDKKKIVNPRYVRYF
jgi:type IX secretion system PorP/SprF family membrane protein